MAAGRALAAAAAAAVLVIAALAPPAASSRVLEASEADSPSPTPAPATASEKARNEAPKSSNGEKDGELKGGENPSSGGEESKGGGPTGSPAEDGAKKVCGGRPNCSDGGKLFACLEDFDDAKSNISLHNTGESELKVKIEGNFKDQTVLGKHETEIQIPLEKWNGTEIAFNAGNGDCILHLPSLQPHVSDGMFRTFPQLPTPTPIHGLFLLAFIVTIVGGTWACCKFAKRDRRHDDGVPYQQLEMGVQPQSGSAIPESSTADGWDENWDEDWEEEEAVAAAKPQDKSSSVNVSSPNGVSSKAPNKDGWDDDWDD